MPPTINELMTKTIYKAFQPDKAAGVDTVMQFNFTGEQASQWVVTIKNQKIESKQGVHPSPEMTMSVSSEDYLKIASGEMDASLAFMKGRVKVSGDMGVALGMGKYFDFSKPSS